MLGFFGFASEGRLVVVFCSDPGILRGGSVGSKGFVVLPQVSDGLSG
jgi:hypothetical protein